jgi:hypothetical protein
MSVQTHLSDLASSLILSSTENESIQTSISTLRSRLSDHFGSQVKEQLRFGSSTRFTMLPRKADEEADVDYMVIFDNTADLKPQTFIDRLKRFAEAKYSRSDIYQSHPTIVLELNHIKFELVPAYKDWFGNIYIPATSGYMNWMSTDPNGFNDSLTNKNQGNDYLIKPMIRLMKYWNAQNDYVYESYELEKAIVNASYMWCKNLRDYFFEGIDDLPTWNLSSQLKKDRVQRAKDLMNKIKQLESDGYPASAAVEIQKLVPSLSSVSSYMR